MCTDDLPISTTYSHQPDLHTTYFNLSLVTPYSNITSPLSIWSQVTVVQADIYPNTTIITQHKYLSKSLSRTCTRWAFLDWNSDKSLESKGKETLHVNQTFQSQIILNLSIIYHIEFCNSHIYLVAILSYFNLNCKLI